MGGKEIMKGTAGKVVTRCLVAGGAAAVTSLVDNGDPRRALGCGLSAFAVVGLAPLLRQMREGAKDLVYDSESMIKQGEKRRVSWLRQRLPIMEKGADPIGKV